MGGVMILLFGTIASLGLKTLIDAQVNLVVSCRVPSGALVGTWRVVWGSSVLVGKRVNRGDAQW